MNDELKSRIKNLSIISGIKFSNIQFPELWIEFPKGVNQDVNFGRREQSLKDFKCGFIDGFQSCHDLMKKDYDALRDENDILKNSPFCHICGSCGEGGCCNPKHCLYPDSKEERIVSLENYIKDLEINYIEKAKVQKLVEALRFYADEQNWGEFGDMHDWYKIESTDRGELARQALAEFEK